MNRKGFTLAETLITLTILGVVAALTVPGLVRKQVEKTNRTKVKKAMAVYETVMNEIAIYKNIKSNDGLVELNTGNCSITSNYFKKVTDLGCTFKTSDGLWWNIEDIQKPVISLKKIDENDSNQTLAKVKEYASDMNNYTAFYFIGQFDNIGILRINDKGWETNQTNQENKQIVWKLYDYITMTKYSYDFNSAFSSARSRMCRSTGPYKDCNRNGKMYDSNGNVIYETGGCYVGIYGDCYNVKMYNDRGIKIFDSSKGKLGKLDSNGNIVAMGSNGKIYDDNGKLKFTCSYGNGCYAESLNKTTLTKGETVYNNDFTKEICNCTNNDGCTYADGAWSGCE